MDKQKLLTDYLIEKNTKEFYKIGRKNNMKKLVIGLVILAAGGYGVLSYHFILLDDSMKILKKTSLAYENTFVDARGAKKLELALKPDLIAAGINDVIGDVSKSIKKETN
jgi:hypothetical protein